MTGLVYLNNRYHDPQLGVFISVDPLVAATGEPYVYAGANPTTYSDPSGLCDTSSESAARCYAALWNTSDESLITVGGHEDRNGGGPGTSYRNWAILPEPSDPGPVGPPFDPDSLDLEAIRDVLTGALNGWDSPAVGVCGGMEGTAGIGAGWETCFVTTTTNNGQISTLSVGEAGAKGVLKAGGMISNAQRMTDLEGWDVCFGAGGAAGAGGGGQGCVSVNNVGVPTGVVTLSGSIQAGLGADGGVSFAYTTVVWDDNGALGFIRDLFDSNFDRIQVPVRNPDGTFLSGGQQPWMGPSGLPSWP